MAETLAEFPPFAARLPWWGGDLQTLRNVLLRAAADLSAWPAARLELPLRDGSGDRLAAALHRPHGEARREARRREAKPAGQPLVLLIHGLTGCEDSAYVLAGARHWLQRGHAVLRLNLRGAGPSRPLCRGQYHAGRTDDLRDALAALPESLGAQRFDTAGMIAVGYSLGGNMLLKYLGEEGRAAPFLAAATVSAPLDLGATTRRMQAPRNALYHRVILARMKDEARAPAAALDEGERRAIAAARTIQAFDDSFVAPRNGFAGADDYYARCSAGRYLAGIAVPTLLIHALDDPWIPADAYLGTDWPAHPALTPLLPAGGGHVGFHDKAGTGGGAGGGAGGTAPWHDRAIADFVANHRS